MGRSAVSILAATPPIRPMESIRGPVTRPAVPDGALDELVPGDLRRAGRAAPEARAAGAGAGPPRRAGVREPSGLRLPRHARAGCAVAGVPRLPRGQPAFR